MTLLIKNVRLLGSDLGPEAKADVFVSGENISAIGDFSRKSADEVIDGQRGYLAPGFIDVDSTSDHYLTLFDNPGQEDFLKHVAPRPLGVNFATFAGHATIRRAILGEDVRDLTKNETDVFVSVLQRAIAEG